MSSVDGRKLSIERTGGARLKTRADGSPDTAQEVILAGWQSEQHGVPRRCVVRCDGAIQVPTVPGLGNTFAGMPTAVLRVDYSIGGFQRSVLVDAVNQSALTVWAESIEVLGVWDQRRILRMRQWLAENGAPVPYLGCETQLLGTAVSVGPNGDTGPADARWLDLVTHADSDAAGVSVHPIPAGARAVRLLNGTLAAGGIIEASSVVSALRWLPSYEPPSPPIHHETAQSACAYDVPAGCQVLVLDTLGYPADTYGPIWLEWILSPRAL